MSNVIPSIPERVQKGIDLLNEKVPGWFNKIDLEKFDISSSCRCVLGQALTPHFNKALALLGLNQVDFGPDFVELYGFDFPRFFPEEEVFLEEEWRRRISAMQKRS